ncbi:unnamed protein product [Menidia menidia]|uniref:(Atlantic silverside) hypothetical protein n=1 Tax=Menidia menidia TaxID=238744 RepID=A0A8S4BDV4_9TELE|nr:unnamed protein product [Menidia menidia]
MKTSRSAAGNTTGSSSATGQEVLILKRQEQEVLRGKSFPFAFPLRKTCRSAEERRTLRPLPLRLASTFQTSKAAGNSAAWISGRTLKYLPVGNPTQKEKSGCNLNSLRPKQIIHGQQREMDQMRLEFVKRVPAEILRELLDALVADRVFNHLEEEEIIEENATRANRARRLIDDVRKKGEKACRAMLKHLQTLDPMLFSQLCFQCDPSTREGKATCSCQIGSHDVFMN